MKYLPGSVYVNSISNSLADSGGNIGALIFVYYISTKKGFLSAFLMTIIGSTIVALAELFDHTDPNKASVADWAVPFGILLAKFGTSCSFNYLYFTIVFYFPSEYLGLAMGMSNFVGRLSTVAAPMVAEQSAPFPMGVSLTVAFMGLCASQIIIKLSTDDEESKSN